MKKHTKLALVCICIFSIVALISFAFSDRISYEIIKYGSMEKSESFEAIIIRDETVVESKDEGIVESMVSEYEMVKKNKRIASIYESKVDDGAKARLEDINLRIDEITKAKQQLGQSSAGGFRGEGAIDVKVAELTKAMDKGDMEKVADIRRELNLLNDKKNAISENKDNIDEIMERLMEEKEKYEKSLGNSKEDIYAPMAGLYTTDVDGFETILNPEGIREMTPYDFDSVNKMRKSDKQKRKENAVCKIIRNTSWNVVFTASQKELGKLKEGSNVYLRAANYDQEVPGYISYISTPVNGNYTVAVTSSETCSWALTERFLEIDLIRSKYSGLKVPIDALRVVDNSTGVYTVVDGIVHFKKVNVLCKDSRYAIVEEDNTQRGGLLLYDEVIVSSSKKLKVGGKIS